MLKKQTRLPTRVVVKGNSDGFKKNNKLLKKTNKIVTDQGFGETAKGKKNQTVQKWPFGQKLLLE